MRGRVRLGTVVVVLVLIAAVLGSSAWAAQATTPPATGT